MTLHEEFKISSFPQRKLDEFEYTSLVGPEFITPILTALKESSCQFEVFDNDFDTLDNRRDVDYGLLGGDSLLIASNSKREWLFIASTDIDVAVIYFNKHALVPIKKTLLAKADSNFTAIMKKRREEMPSFYNLEYLQHWERLRGSQKNSGI
ncbi:hypothetical protein WJT74_11985 [Sphingomicrobium sp. XHP0239]|uniref:hypothetical protein n=1 Tax=Sphingomicrobium maritimum TaxID=3133972 RepID=UPI0031CCD53C